MTEWLRHPLRWLGFRLWAFVSDLVTDGNRVLSAFLDRDRAESFAVCCSEGDPDRPVWVEKMALS
jgi:hypothetical protein